MLNRVRLRNTSSSQRRVAPSAVALFEIGNRFAVADEHHCPNPPPDIPGLIAGAISEERIAAYRAALEEYTRDRVPLDWAMTQNNLGTALRALGEWEQTGRRFRWQPTGRFGPKRHPLPDGFWSRLWRTAAA
jgi:hypothetical protein